jgi:uncharacterized protein YvpB
MSFNRSSSLLPSFAALLTAVSFCILCALPAVAYADVLNPFGEFKGQAPAETAKDRTFSDKNAKPTAAEASGQGAAGLSSVESLASIAKKAWDTLTEAVKSKDVEKLKEARKYYNDLVYATSRKNGKYLYFLGRVNEELYYATKAADYQKQALANFGESVQKLNSEPDASGCVSLKDAIKKTYFEQGRFGASGLGSATITSSDGSANVRGSANGSIMGTVPSGSKLDIVGKEGSWFKVNYNNRIAYIHESQMKENSAAGSSASASSSSSSPASGASATKSASGPSSSGGGGTDVPYFCQYDNAYKPGGSCQNTSAAMILRKYGWGGTPDTISNRFGTYMGQTPQGLANVFNTLASEKGLGVRAKAYSAASMSQMNGLLSSGKPVIVFGWFTRSGHVIVLKGYDGSNYISNDPAGKWGQSYKGGYPYGASGGKGAKYGKYAISEALVEGGTIWMLEFN